MRMAGRILITGFSLAILALAISFTASNDAMIALSLWPFQTTLSMPLWLVGLGGFGLGLVLGGLLMALPLMARTWQRNRLNRKLKAVEKQQAAQQSGQQSARKDDNTPPMLPKP